MHMVGCGQLVIIAMALLVAGCTAQVGDVENAAKRVDHAVDEASQYTIDHHETLPPFVRTQPIACSDPAHRVVSFHCDITPGEEGFVHAHDDGTCDINSNLLEVHVHTWLVCER